MEFDGIWMFFFKFGFCMLDFHGFSESWILDFESWIRGFDILDFCRSLIWDFSIWPSDSGLSCEAMAAAQGLLVTTRDSPDEQTEQTTASAPKAASQAHRIVFLLTICVKRFDYCQLLCVFCLTCLRPWILPMVMPQKHQLIAMMGRKKRRRTEKHLWTTQCRTKLIDTPDE